MRYPKPNSSWVLSPSFDEFYSANVQPLLDRGMSALNGTRVESEEKSRVGYRLRHAGDFDDGVAVDGKERVKSGAHAKYRIVLVPGFVTTGLELWEGHECFKSHFRQRLWGSVSMARAFFSDRECWRRHLALDPRTGLDPKGVRLRSAQGFEAADNFVASYWVFAKMIENLADVGYDGSTMTMMSYDWRLGYEMMEKRDGFFTKLKMTVEAHFITSGQKVVLVSHSMGGTVVYYFLQWVITDVKYGGGGGGKAWVDKHIHAFVNIAGTLLGVPKAIPALLSGELKDTAAVFVQFAQLLEQYFGRKWRKNLWNTWGSLFGMLPKGGDPIWGIGADVVVGEDNHGAEFRDASQLRNKSETIPTIAWTKEVRENCSKSPFNESNWTMENTLDYIYEYGGGYQEHVYSKIFSHYSKRGWKERANSKHKRKHWHDPIAVPLPRAPAMKIYCLYGVGVPTERSYYYKVDCEKLDHNQTCSSNTQYDAQPHLCSNGTADEGEPLEWPAAIDTSVYDIERNIQYGVRFSDGDGSVPLLSLGYMCQKWAEPRSRHNPSSISVVTRERKHIAELSLSDPVRGGPQSGEHVDILGNVGVIEDVIRIVTGFEVEEKVDREIIMSELKEITRRIDSHPSGGLKTAFQ
eukprot:CCRYP_002600-RA/>CCRYP_002600-RA protein AED:0.37 eAED:0.37 QI:330/1/1/1/0.75/0.6/5/139/633